MAFSDRQNTFKRSAPERVLGIIGYPLEHTLSPAMHNAAFAVSGLDWVYAAFRVPPGSASAAVEAMRVLGLGGLSVTIPHKEEVLSALDVLEPEAQAIGAVNTVFWTPDRDQLVGANTDVEGFEKGLKTALGINLEGRSVVIIGAGGSARAVLWGGRYPRCPTHHCSCSNAFSGLANGAQNLRVCVRDVTFPDPAANRDLFYGRLVD